MKRATFLIVSLIIGGHIFSQNWDDPEYIKDKKHEGFVILNNGDTLHGMLKAQYPADLSSKNQVSIMVSNQYSCLFYAEGETKATRYKAKDIKEYMIGGRRYVSFDYYGGLAGNSKCFALQVKEGLSEFFTIPVKRISLLLNQTMNQPMIITIKLIMRKVFINRFIMQPFHFENH